MKVVITITEAQTISDLTSHLQVLRDALIIQSIKRGLDPSDDIEPLPELDDYNCYGNHEISFFEDEDTAKEGAE